jgi:hypothetical protein
MLEFDLTVKNGTEELKWKQDYDYVRNDEWIRKFMVNYLAHSKSPVWFFATQVI